MVQRNKNIAKLKTSYLFPEINARKRKFLEQNPLASLISLGVGDTTYPLSKHIAKALADASLMFATTSGYIGYGPELGNKSLREKITSRIYRDLVQPDEIIISDGAKCDIGRLQLLFGNDISIAVQDPAYPVYVDGSIMHGINHIVMMPCLPENDYFPDLNNTPRTDLIYFCSPNNPTGAVATKAQLKSLVEFAKANRSIILFDSAYASYIQDPELPKSIFEIDGSRETAIEIGSFSKLAGFTGIRLGWTVVPDQLKYDDGRSVKADWHRVMSTIFNGASIISQMGGQAVLEEDGWLETKKMVEHYLENAEILRKSLIEAGHQLFGSVNAPYLWAYYEGKNSWEVFQDFLENLHLVTTPGSGFGPSGEGFIRFSAFARRENILDAVQRIKTRLAP